MKLKITLFLIIAAMFTSVFTFEAHAQKKQRASQYTMAISGDPLELLLNDLLYAQFEMLVSKNNSFTIRGYYWLVNGWNAYGIGGSYRWYFYNLFNDKKIPLEGFSAGPAVQIGFWDWDGDNLLGDRDYGGSSIAIGGEAAYKWVFGAFVLEPMIQILFYVDEPTGLGSLNAFGASILIGYAWN